MSILIKYVRSSKKLLNIIAKLKKNLRFFYSQFILTAKSLIKIIF